MSRHSWPGIACGFMLFILVFLYEKLSASPDNSLGKADLGMLLFVVPGLLGGLLLRNGSLYKPLYGVLLALPVCFALAHFWGLSVRPAAQEIAWLFSSVFWCAIGTFTSLFINTLRRRIRIYWRTHARL
ncbi:hypothetical protein GWD52_15275 [Enterobacteriaceae bacterium 4M9]|nr:hypothetical protein [Enterobacteriaceae bacterium 4M9]